MQKRILGIILAAGAMLLSCSKQPIRFSVMGDANVNTHRTTRTVCFTNWDTQTTDTLAVDNGPFRYEGEVTKPTVFTCTMERKCLTAFVIEHECEVRIERIGWFGYPQEGCSPMNDSLRTYLLTMEDEYEADRLLDYTRTFLSRNPNIMGAYCLCRAEQMEMLSREDIMTLAKESTAEVLAFVEKAYAEEEEEVYVAPVQGKPYIDFEVEYEGETHRLSDYVGGANRVTVVDFWASWCPPCKAELPYLISLWERYRDQGVMVVGVASWDKPEDTKHAIEHFGITYPQIINAQRIGTDAYGITGIPQILLISHDGIVLATDLSEEGIEEAVKAALGEE